MKTRWIFLFIIAGLGFFTLITHSQQDKRLIEKFSKDSQTSKGIDGWDEKSFVGRTQYAVIQEDSNFVLRADADSAASGLYKKIKYDLKEFPFLSWRWKVVHLPEKGDVRYKETDDYGARVYVVFPKFLKWQTKTISYIWANRLSPGKSHPNPWLPKNVVMIAVKSGTDDLGKWFAEKRNVYEDYKRLFGKEPPKVGAIALMSDSDNTGGKAEAFYDDFFVSQN
ncbi:MAG: DUF3047 domain-containing protein [Calditrichaeota bacterium]|nr:DUF3047 domain-containing protein [Calditrichota bacterium]